ncbi:thiolase family protein [Propylenella binzhouense]|uniref:propanoyl-CoA C-acyltransferase n=1 Tax=Propylenella binzhouense TaxID=2555902 RepID=A0A964T0W0_9HYPH|nr:thiolase family protein [Propylenella binzhouense]MYZ46361.1 thiolase family protein [Propylenella binzhouense]
MVRAAIAGVGMVPFAKMREKSLADIGWPAVKAAIADAGIEPKALQACYCGTSLGGMMAGQRILGRMGLTGIPVTNIENACSSSSSALAQAVLAVRAGKYEAVLVVGAEKLTKFGGGTLPLEKEDWEVSQGLVMPALYAMRAKRYMHEYGLTELQLAKVSVKNRKNGALNPDAQYRQAVTVEDVLGSRMIAEPFTLLQCCPTGDGAAALVVTSEKLARKLRSDPVFVAASELTSGRFTAGFRDMTTPEITVRGAAEAYEEAGLGPEDIDVAEVHDAFSIAELIYYDAFGFSKKGEAGALIDSGATEIGGRVAVNPSGGLISKGHPIGATGAAQVVEITRQLRGECGPRQVPGAKVGLAHATGGGISGFDHGACAIHILTR